jgi:hypothetical protein
MADCTIYRVRVSWAFGIDPNGCQAYARPVKKWQARCPQCGPLTYGSRVWSHRPPQPETHRSRKLAKDSLYRHRRATGH